jgi:hypothetical protein
MAVIVSNGATNLSTASGFYRAETYNLSPYSTTYLALSTARQIAVTFANAGNCQGLILYLTPTNSSTKDVTVTLQENTGSWVDRASATLTAAQITNSVASNAQATWITPFTFSVPYAVNTTAGIWRFNITQSAGGSNNWNLRTSNGSAPSYIAWCDNALSYTTNDVIIAKDKITIDQNCQFNGLLSTGDSTYSVCAVACTGSTGDYNNNGMIVWDNTPAASYTMTINGLMILSAHAGFHVGDSANRIPYAQKAIVQVIPATSGTNTNSGISNGGVSSHASVTGRMNIQMYGEIPTTRSTTLASDAAASQPDIVTTDSTGWAIGDRVAVCKADIAGAMPETIPHTISSISGTNITLTANLATYVRKAGGHVFRLNGYGVEFESTHTASILQQYNGGNNFAFSGVWMKAISFYTTNGTSAWYDDDTNIGFITIDDCAYSNGNVTGGTTLLMATNFKDKDMSIQRNHWFRASPIGTFYGPPSSTKTFNDNIVAFGQYGGFARLQNMIIDSNYFYNGSSYSLSDSNGIYNSTITNNYFWGVSAVYRNNGGMVNVVWQNNSHQRTSRIIWSFSSMINVKFIDESVGTEATVDYLYEAFASSSPFADVVFDNPNIGTITAPTANDIENVDGTQVRFQNYDQVANVDFTHMPYGKIYRTGTGLADTTVRTAGGFAMRFEPIFSPNLMHWEQTIPTGNIQNKTMTVSVWVKINNAAYYAGTHTKPTLTIDYDNGTTLSSVATTGTGWQQLAVVFTPTTTYGQIEMKITGATDATGTNRYFYVDDVNVAYPAGVAIDLGNLDLWAEGLPVSPAIATMPSLGGVWDEPMSAHTIPGSMGKAQNDTNRNSGLIPATV